MKLSEKDRNTAFALLAIIALASVAFVFFFSESQDAPAADANPFYALLLKSDKAGILYDVRGASDSQAQSIYQCGVNIISKGAFAGKQLQIIGCNAEGCLSSSPGSASSQMAFEQAKAQLSGKPYLLLDGAADSGLKYFQRHLQITIGNGVASDKANCSISIGSG